jgi:hypothetical protein
MSRLSVFTIMDSSELLGTVRVNDSRAIHDVIQDEIQDHESRLNHVLL